VLPDGFCERAENENYLVHSGAPNVFERFPQHSALAQAQQLLRFSHARGLTNSQNDGAHS
jgi:hypothetical protein